MLLVRRWAWQRLRGAPPVAAAAVLASSLDWSAEPLQYNSGPVAQLPSSQVPSSLLVSGWLLVEGAKGRGLGCCAVEGPRGWAASRQQRGSLVSTRLFIHELEGAGRCSCCVLRAAGPYRQLGASAQPRFLLATLLGGSCGW